MTGADLVCWDFGDTLVDERFMRLAPDGVPDWQAAYEAVLAERPEWVAGWDLGAGSLNDLVIPLADRLPMRRVEVAHHLRTVWHRIEWFPERAALGRAASRPDRPGGRHRQPPRVSRASPPPAASTS